MTVSMIAWLVVIDIAVIVVISVFIGFLAPRFPARWLSRDRFLLHLMGWESPQRYRRLRVPWLAAHLPELGAVFGGQSKASLPGFDSVALGIYLAEVRRAEIVHWVSFFSWVPLAFFNPWWLTAIFAGIVILGNAPFIAILRFNRVRILRVLENGSTR